MRNIIKKYYKLDEETKEMLEALYMFNELETTAEDFEDVGIYNIRDKEIFLDIAMNCTYLTDLGPDKIVRRLLEILSCRDITLEDMNELDTDTLVELMEGSDDESKESNSKIITDFIYKDLFCLLLKSNDKYILTYIKENDIRRLVFNSLEEILAIIIQRDLILSQEES